MKRPRCAQLVYAFLVLASTVSGQENDLETQPLAGLRPDVAAVILGAQASGDLLAGHLDASADPAASDDGLYGVEFYLRH